MKLSQIGFYTLSDVRAQLSSSTSQLWRCELILTGRCNFKCPYCRGLRPDFNNELSRDEAFAIVDEWLKHGLRNVRFSGGEPTLWKDLPDLAWHCRQNNVHHIAVSTNGSASRELYDELICAGVNDFSVSLDSGCCSTGEIMTGGVRGAWERVVENIKFLASRTYVTAGIVFTPENVDKAAETIAFADSLGVRDIRVISSAQYNQAILQLKDLPQEILNRHPILKYRCSNFKNDIPIRGMGHGDCSRCKLVLDDMAVMGGYHFPRVIYMREGGDPIGKVGPDMRADRQAWYENHDSFKDPICKNNCLDVCVAFNNFAREGKDE